MADSMQMEHMGRLTLLDLKAQKKGINYKKFFNIPLNFHEQIASQTALLAHESHNILPPAHPQPKLRARKLAQLAHPRQQPQQGQRQNTQPKDTNNVKKIINQCHKLQARVMTQKKLGRFRRDSNKYYDYLQELAAFNFQKHQKEFQ